MTSHEDFDWFKQIPQDDEEERKVRRKGRGGH
jgi:hypothetical protein